MAERRPVTTTERRSVIVTFKRKDQRPDRTTDKVDIVRSALTQGVQQHFLSATTLPMGAARPPFEPHLVGYDVNQYEVPIVTAQLTEGEITALRQNDNVAMVEDDAPCYALEGPFAHLAVENQPSPLAETIPTGVQQVNAPQAWGYSQGKGIRVAVVDTGIDFNHPDIKPNYVGGASFVPGAATPMDDQGHGTHCAGTIAAAVEGSNVVGVAPQASLYGVKVLDRNGSGQFSWIIAGIDWCIQNGMHVVSMSLGGSSAPTALETMCNTAWSKGLLLVAAAGNANQMNAGPTGRLQRRVSRQIPERHCGLGHRFGQRDRPVQQPRSGGRRLRPGRQRAVGQARWWYHHDEWHQHGLPARSWGGSSGLGVAPLFKQ